MHKPAQYVKPRTQEFYLVMVRVRPMNEGDPNTEVVAAKLRYWDAKKLCDQVPGSWLQKVVATKP
jgi:hypothetical protein